MRVAVWCLVSTFLFPLAALAADGQQVVDCSSTCPDGQVMISFADGNKVTCVCQAPAAMDPTVPDESIVDDGEQVS